MLCSRSAGCACAQCALSAGLISGGEPQPEPEPEARAGSGSRSGTALARRGAAGDDRGLEVDDRAMLHVMTNARNPMEFAGPDGMQKALEQFGPAPGGRDMMDRERQAAEAAVASGTYGVWRSQRTNEDCGRIGAASRCFCGAPFSHHRTVPPHGCVATGCERFRYIPQRPEEVGEWWLPRRKGFDVRAWRAKCQCGHGHDAHDATTLGCRHAGCGCARFISAFCCLVCDRPWEEHETLWESRQERVDAGRAVDAAFIPLAETPAISELVFGERRAELGDAALRPPQQQQRSRGRALADRPDAAAQAAETRERRQVSLQAKKAPRPKKAAAADPFYRSAVCDVYAQHAPERLPEVDEILGRWAGREQQLLMKLHKKYGRTMSRPTK